MADTFFGFVTENIFIIYKQTNFRGDISFAVDTPARCNNDRSLGKSSISIHKSVSIRRVADGMQKRTHCAMHFEFVIAGESKAHPRETCNLSDRGSAIGKDKVLSSIKIEAAI